VATFRNHKFVGAFVCFLHKISGKELKPKLIQNIPEFSNDWITVEFFPISCALPMFKQANPHLLERINPFQTLSSSCSLVQKARSVFVCFAFPIDGFAWEDFIHISNHRVRRRSNHQVYWANRKDYSCHWHFRIQFYARFHSNASCHQFIIAINFKFADGLTNYYSPQ